VPVSNLEALRARDDLLAVAASWAALQARLLPAPGKGEPVSGSAEPRSPIDIGVSDLMYRIEQHARFLGKMLLDETVDWQPTTSTMPASRVTISSGEIRPMSGTPLERAIAPPLA